MGALQPGRHRGESLVVVLVTLSVAGCMADFLSGPHRGSSSGPPNAPPAQILYVKPDAASLTSLGDSAQFQASWWTDGTLTPATGCTWSVADDTVAAAMGNGVVTATGNGKTTVSATCGDTTASAQLGVWQAVASAAIVPGQLRMDLGESDAIQGQARDARGNFMERPIDFSWTSTNALVASVQPDQQDPSHAVVTKYFPGSAQIKMAVEGKTATANVR